MLGVLISLNNFLCFDMVDVKLFWKVKHQNLIIFDALIHLMHLILGKGNWVAYYFKKEERVLEGCLGMLSSKHTTNIWLLFKSIFCFLLFDWRNMREFEC